MKQSGPPAAASPDALLVTTGSMRTLLPEVFYRQPQPSAVNAVDGDLRFIEVNDAWLRFFGMERDQVAGHAARDVPIWASAERRQQFGELVRTHQRLQNFEIRARRHDGIEADLLFSWETLEHDGRTCLLSTFTDITARTEAARLLRESEQRFAAIVEHSPQPMTVTRLDDGVYLNVNRAFETVFGYNRAQVIGRSSLELGIWQGGSTVRDELKRQFGAGQTVASVETQARTRDGRLIDIFFSATVIDIDGQPALHGTVFDLTQIRQAVQARAISEERFAKMFRANPDPVVIARRADGRYVEMNDAWVEQFGYVREHSIGRTSAELGVWDAPAERERMLHEIAQHGAVRGFETRFRRHSGAVADVVLTAEPIVIDQADCLIICLVDVTEQRRAEAQRALSEQRFAAIFSASPDAICMVRVDDGVHLEVNDAWLGLYGRERAQVIGVSADSLRLWPTPADRAAMIAELQRNGRLRNYETIHLRSSGEPLYVSTSADKIVLDGAEVMISCTIDITWRKRDERLRLLSEQRFAKVFGATPSPMVIINRASGAYTDVNQAWLALYGYARDEVIGRSATQLGIWVNPEDRLRLIKLGQTFERVRGIEARQRAKSGALLDVITSMEPIELDVGPCWIVSAEDVTARHREAQLRMASEERFARVFHASPSPILIIDQGSGKYSNANDAWLQLYGYSHAEIIGRNSAELGIWCDPEDRNRLMAQRDATGSVRGFEAKHRTKSGSVIEVLSSMEPVMQADESAWVVCVEDVTARRRAERLRQASEDRFTKVFQSSPVALLIVHLDTGAYADVNQAWLDLYGYTSEQVIGRTSAELGVWVDRDERDRVLAQPAVHSVEVRHRRSDGEILDIVESIEQIDLDGRIARIVCVEDVTRQRRAERARAQMEERFGKVFDAGPHPIVFSRASDGAGMHVNQAWHELLGYTVDDIAGQTSETLQLWVDADFRERRKQLMARGEPVRNLETRMRAKSGATVDVLVSSEQVSFDGEQYILTMMTNITERKRADEQIQYLATRDQLTGLPNRLLFSDRLRIALTRAARDHSRLALLFIDLDHFKDINDTLGHQAGDHLLMEVAARLSALVRGADTLGRQGGDEFLLLLDGLAEGADAGPVARKLVDALSAPFDYHGRAMKVSCSVGISIYPDDARTEDDLLRNADLAMYAAKESGRHGHRFYSHGMNQRLQERITLEEQLRTAVERQEFVLHYQPKVNFESGLVTGCEALLRWHRPGHGLWQPNRFVSTAEATRLIVPIGAWVLRDACTTLRRWLDAGLAPVQVACNLSVHQFSTELPAQLEAILRDTGVPAHLLQLEITETVMMTNAAAHLDTMRRLKALGVQIALDDFGTGYSSLSYLRHMDLDVLKIDRSFVRDLDSSVDAQAIVAAIIAMARSFGLQTVAEGVESPEQAGALRRMRCDDYQGFLFSQPLPVEQFESQYLLPA